MRGDRRKTIRNEPDRRVRLRTPGKFKEACDVAFAAWRRLEASRGK